MEKPKQSSPKKSRILYVLIGSLGLAMICSIGLCLFISVLVSAPHPSWYDCMALMEDDSIVVFSGATKTAYRSNDEGITWSRDPTISIEPRPNCSWNWPVTVGTNPPIVFYYMGRLGIYQSLDGGETLTLVPPLDSSEVEAMPSVVVTQSDTLIVFIGDGELWLRLPSGEWIRYEESFHKLLPAPK